MDHRIVYVHDNERRPLNLQEELDCIEESDYYCKADLVEILGKEDANPFAQKLHYVKPKLYLRVELSENKWRKSLVYSYATLMSIAEEAAKGSSSARYLRIIEKLQEPHELKTKVRV